MAKKASLTESGFNLSGHLDKKFKGAAMKIVNPHDDDSPTKVKRWVSTGCRMFDIATSNLKDRGGYPSGRLTVLYGPEQSGKSLAAMHALAETQKAGGVAVYIDTESALHEGFAEAIGIKFDETFHHVTVQDLNIIFKVVLESIEKIRQHFGDVPMTVVIDSIAGATTEKDESKKDFNSKGYNTEKAKMLSDGLGTVIQTIAQEDVCLIITNQARVNFDAGQWGNPWKMPHGQSLPHYASIIVRMHKGKKITMEMVKDWKRAVGRETVVTIEKNRLGPPESKINFDIYFDRGIDDFGSWEIYIKRFKIVNKNNSWYDYQYVDKETGEVVEYKEQGWKTFCDNVLAKNPKVADEIWDKIADHYIMHYSKNSADAESLERET